jgi:hypothetical protein
VSLIVFDLCVANTALQADTKVAVFPSRAHHAWIIRAVTELAQTRIRLEHQEVVISTFDLFFVETIFTNIVRTPTLLAAPHAFHFLITTKATVVAFAISFELAVVGPF